MEARGFFFLTENSYLPTFEIVALNEVGITRLSTPLVWLVILCECEKNWKQKAALSVRVNAARKSLDGTHVVWIMAFYYSM